MATKAFLQKVKKAVLLTTLFLTPIFFLPFTQEFYATNKFYLLTVSAGILILISTLEFLMFKKLILKRSGLDNAFFLLILSLALSLVISTSNRLQAVINPSFGFTQILSLIILSYYVTRELKIHETLNTLVAAGWVVAIVVIISFFQPFKNVNLPLYLGFLKSPLFSPVGGVVETGTFLGFIVVYSLFSFKSKVEKRQLSKTYIFASLSLLFSLSSLLLLVYFVINKKAFLTLPPLSISWYAAVEILKKPFAALFGAGLDNFSVMFAKVKDVTYNQSNLWNIGSFNLAGSAVLHLFTETGLLGLVSFLIIVFYAFKKVSRHTVKYALFIYTLAVLLFLPPSLISWFLFFVLLAMMMRPEHEGTVSLDLSKFIPVYIGIVALSVIALGFSYYFLGRSYASEIYFKKGLNAFVKNDVKGLYDNQRTAVLLAPYKENFRTSFSQTNLLIANNIARRLQQEAKDKKKNEILARDRQTMTQAIQAAIVEAKAAVALNPQKASSWANLAGVYRNVLNIAQGADVWTISAYQRAIIADPQNPTYRLNLGGVYFALQKYKQAVNLFQQAVAIKPNWANAHYNLAWALYKKGDYQTAVLEMQTTLNLIDAKKSKADYEKAKKDLEEFKKKLPKQTQQQPKQEQKNTEIQQLSIPTPPVATLSPKINLPKDASPETK